MKRIDELTGLRCVAVAMVVIAHCRPAAANLVAPDGLSARLLGNGELGVRIFFVLSGYLITRLLCEEWQAKGSIDFLAFYRRRVLRTFPAFYAYLGCVALLGLGGWASISVEQLRNCAFYLWNYSSLLGLDSSDPAHADGRWLLGHTWSLALEEQFYLLWPALLPLVLGGRWRFVLPAFILAVPCLSIATYLAFPSLRNSLDVMFHTACDFIVAGCYAVFLSRSLPPRAQRFVSRQIVFWACGLLLFVVAPAISHRLGGYWSSGFGRTVEAGLIVCLLLCILSQPQHVICQVLRTLPFRYIGTISYSLYLWQQLFTFEGFPFAQWFPLNVLAAMLAASLSYALIERPFLLMKDRRDARTRESSSKEGQVR